MDEGRDEHETFVWESSSPRRGDIGDESLDVHRAGDCPWAAGRGNRRAEEPWMVVELMRVAGGGDRGRVWPREYLWLWCGWGLASIDGWLKLLGLLLVFRGSVDAKNEDGYDADKKNHTDASKY